MTILIRLPTLLMIAAVLSSSAIADNSAKTLGNMYAKYYGTYKYENNGTITISKGSETGKLKFNILNTTDKGCVAEAEGEMIIISTGEEIHNYAQNYSPEQNAMAHATHMAMEEYEMQLKDIKMRGIYVPKEDNETGLFIIFYGGGKIYVEEVAMEGYYHHGGMNCGVTGTYRK